MLLIADVLTLLLIIEVAGLCSSRFACCCLCVPIAIAIAIVGSRSGCSSCCCFGVPVAIAIVGSCSGCTWREGRHDDKDIDRGRVKVVDAAKGLLRRETNKQMRVRL